MWPQGKIIFTGQFHKPPIKLYETLTSENTHFTHPRCFTMICENLYRAGQGKVQGGTGQKCVYRAKLIWPPMFFYDLLKSHFSRIIVFLRVNFKIGKIYRAKLRKISANTKIFFEFLLKLHLNEKKATDVSLCTLMKNTHFCQFMWVHFQISLNVLYETILNYTLSLKHK